MRKNILFCGIIGSIFLLTAVWGLDVAYLYSSSNEIEQGVLDVFLKFNFSMYYVNKNTLWYTNFSNYDLVFIGDEQFNKDLGLTGHPLIVMNPYLGEETGLTNSGGVNQLSASEPL